MKQITNVIKKVFLNLKPRPNPKTAIVAETVAMSNISVAMKNTSSFPSNVFWICGSAMMLSFC